MLMQNLRSIPQIPLSSNLININSLNNNNNNNNEFQK
jgi:hypothetical protein